MYLEKFRLDGRIAFVTGGAQGIGRSCADALAEAGATVITGAITLILVLTDEPKIRNPASAISAIIPVRRMYSTRLAPRTS